MSSTARDMNLSDSWETVDLSVRELIYGPINSQRLGHSLGINLLGAQKVCSYDCVYCDLGTSDLRMNQIKKDVQFVAPEVVVDTLRDRLRTLVVNNQPLDHITFSGNGEPTLHPQFQEIAEAVMRVRHELAPHIPVVALTNAAHLDNKKVVAGLNILDERIVKVDAGNESVFKAINNSLVRANVTKIFSGCRKLKDTIVQSMFIQGRCDNTQNEDIEDWIEVVGIIRPKIVQIATISRRPAVEGVLPVDEDTLYTISSRLKRRTQIESVVFA